ncbi:MULTISPECIES: FtsX-like permease family protein [Peptoniphilus]|uniref:ABC transporter permease n=1 Tax=Peptoniphilus TaxID=162289 RepID=UPI0001DA9A8E|nr:MULTISPECIES: FtsX-like permease family protein [Peptoniphilus]EFI41960.1 efflux ABC transporter, permease protein [Peptoniphilus sp. oral taxon 386 str. F0131]
MKKRTMYWRMVLGSLARRRSRMFTALLAIAMGATILSGLVTIYYDIPRQMGKEFRSYGANMIVIPTDSDKKITNEQLEEIRRIIPANKLVGIAPYIYQNAKINEQPYMIAGTDLKQARENSPYWLIHGKWPEKSREVLLGNEISKVIGLSAGDKVTINTPKDDGELTATDFTITGVVTTGGKEEELIFTSLEDLKAIISEENLDVVECSIEAEQGEIQKIVNDIAAADKELTPQMVKRVTESQDIVLTKLQALIWIVTVIVLFIIMICVYTTMMAVVMERRKEIGLKKALGASNKSVVTDFLGEGVILGIAGGALGVSLGYVFAQQVSISVFARKVSFLWTLIPLTIIVSVIITVLACMLPVSKAVDVEPALVLRGE